MTGTAMTEATELWKIYKLDVVAIPTNRQAQRINHPDVIYRTEKEKFDAICDEIENSASLDQLTLSDDKQLLAQLCARSPTAKSCSRTRIER